MSKRDEYETLLRRYMTAAALGEDAEEARLLDVLDIAWRRLSWFDKCFFWGADTFSYFMLRKRKAKR